MKKDLTELLQSMRTMTDARPRAEFRENSRIRILNLVPSAPIIVKQTGFFHFPLPALRWAGAFGVAVALLGGGIVYASQSSLPGSRLYGVKVASETVALDLAPTNSMRTAVAGAVIDRRAQEISELKTYAPPGEVTHAVSDYHNTIDQLKKMHDIDQADIEEHIQKHKDLLEGQSHGESKNEDRGDLLRGGAGERTDESIPTLRAVTSPTPIASPTPGKTESSETISPSVLGTQTQRPDEHRGRDQTDD